MKSLVLLVLLALSGALNAELLEGKLDLPLKPLEIPPIKPPINLIRKETKHYTIIGTSNLTLNVILATYFKDGLEISSTTTTNILLRKIIKSQISAKICNACGYTNGAGICTMMFCRNTMPLERFFGQVISSSWKALAANKDPSIRLLLQNDPNQWIDLLISV